MSLLRSILLALGLLLVLPQGSQESQKTFFKILESHASAWTVLGPVDKIKVIIVYHWFAEGPVRIGVPEAEKIVLIKECVDSTWLPLTRAYLGDLDVFNIVNYCYFSLTPQEIK